MNNEMKIKWLEFKEHRRKIKEDKIENGNENIFYKLFKSVTCR